MSAHTPSPTFRPLYQQIKLLITQGLVSGEWRPGEVIPSETDLATRYSVSQGTVRKAISDLAKENLLVRHQGKGTFVASHNEAQRKFHFLRIAADKGDHVYPEGELISCYRGKADKSTAKLLEIKPGSGILVIHRYMRMAGNPVMLEEIHLPSSVFKGLSAARINQYHCHLYSMFESAYQIRILQVAEQIKAVLADAGTAKMMGVAAGSPLLAIERVSYTYGDKPVEWRRIYCNTQSHSYVNKIV